MLIRSKILTLVLCLAFPSVGFTQDSSIREIQLGNYKYNAFRLHEWMQIKLTLDSVQSKQSIAALLDYYRNVSLLPVYADSSAVRGKRLQTLEKVLNDQLRSILTDSQWIKYQGNVRSTKERALLARLPKK